MDEDVFLVFAALGLLLVGFCLGVVRHWEQEAQWMRFRLSSIIWSVVGAAIGLGLINMSDSWLIVSLWIAFTVWLIYRVWKASGQGVGIRAAWSALILLPLSGWILYFQRFPFLHAIDAEAARMPQPEAAG